MNRIYRAIWNEVTRTFVAAAETARAKGKRSSSRSSVERSEAALKAAGHPAAGSGCAGAPPLRRRLAGYGARPLALEQRFMFDGAAVDTAAAASHTADAAVAERIAGERAGADTLAPAAAVTPAEPGAPRREIVFVEDNVADYGQLVAAIKPGMEVVVLDHARDGLGQMAEALSGHRGLDAIHIVSHGGEAMIDLGTLKLDPSTIGDHGEALARIGEALNSGGDILFYGCEVGAGTDGQGLVTSVARLTSADVAASTDLTGSSALGGNWVLESHAGQIESALFADPLALSGYGGILDTVTGVTNVALSADTGISSTDFVTKTASQTITGTLVLNTSGTTAPVLYVSADGGTTRTNATINGWTNASGAGTFSANVALVAGSGKSLTFYTAASGGSALTGTTAYSLDTTTPSASLSGVSVDLKANSDTGVSPTDNITEASTPTVSVDLSGVGSLAAGDRVQIIDASNGNAVMGSYVIQAADLTGGIWNRTAQDVTLGKLTLGTHNLKAQVGDAAGNAGTPSATPLAVEIVDLTAPNLTSASASASTLTLSFNETGSGLSSGAVPAASAFTVTRNGGTPVAVNSVAVDATNQAVTLGLGANISTNDSDVRVSYTPSGNASDLQDAAGNKAAAFSGRYVSTAIPVFNVYMNQLKFNDLSLQVGTGKAAGDVGLFNNLITVNGQAVDAIVTTVAATGVTIVGYDTATTTVDPNFFELEIKTTAANGAAQFHIDFIKHGTYDAATKTGAPVILQNVALNSYDIDAAGAGQYQFQEFGGFATYTVASNTALTQTNLADNFVHFQNNDGVNGTFNSTIALNGNATADKYRVMALYDAISSFDIKTGVVAANSTAYFYLDFSKGADFASPKTYSNPTINPATTADTTPTLTGTYATSVTNAPLVTVSSVAVTVGGTRYTTANGLTYNGGNWSLTPGALGNGTYDVLVEVTYSDNAVIRDSTSNELVIDTNRVADTTPPTLASIERLNPSSQAVSAGDLGVQDYVDFKVTFSEAVTKNITTDDFKIVGAGGAGAVISALSQIDTSTYSVRVSNIATSNVGNLGLDIAPTHNLVDDAGNLLTNLSPTSGIDQTYQLGSAADTTPPTLTGPGSATGTASALSIPENTAAVHTFAASEAVTWSLAGADAALFQIDASGALSFRAAPDFENPQDQGDTAGNNTYVVDVKGTDAAGNATIQTVTVTVTNVNDNPVVLSDSNAAANTVAENAAVGTTVGVTALGTDADTGAAVTYALTDNAGGRFAIDAATGVVTVAGALDYETATSHTITVKATSSDGSVQSGDFVIAVTNANDNPVVLSDSNVAANTVPSAPMPMRAPPSPMPSPTTPAGALPSMPLRAS
ncbi:MAG: autotransporter-associated beta strand repeat protein [Rhodocyclaceae bacterium]|nr:autotransporter-associated beta strand repeat protein [Rhodocyclaceae bacterium]